MIALFMVMSFIIGCVDRMYQTFQGFLSSFVLTIVFGLNVVEF